MHNTTVVNCAWVVQVCECMRYIAQMHTQTQMCDYRLWGVCVWGEVCVCVCFRLQGWEVLFAHNCLLKHHLLPWGVTHTHTHTEHTLQHKSGSWNLKRMLISLSAKIAWGLSLSLNQEHTPTNVCQGKCLIITPVTAHTRTHTHTHTDTHTSSPVWPAHNRTRSAQAWLLTPEPDEHYIQ